MDLATACAWSRLSLTMALAWRVETGYCCEGQRLAVQGVHGAAGQGLVSFYGWLLNQAQAVDPVLLAGPLPEF